MSELVTDEKGNLTEEVIIEEQDPSSLALASKAIMSSEGVMSDLLATGRVEAVYGEPVIHGENMVIPAAEVLSAAGYGNGVGGGEGGAGGGGGGGGRSFSRPVAVVISGPDGVRVEPVVDVTKVALGFFTMIGFMVSLAARMRKNKIAD